MTEQPQQRPGDDRRRFARELASGIAMVAFILWLTFFGTEGLVELATLAVAVSVLIWFATVDPSRLMTHTHRPSSMLFFLAAIGCALVATGALIIRTATLFFVSLLTIAATLIGFARALSHRYGQPPEERDGIQ